MQKAYIVSAVRSPLTKAPDGGLSSVRTDTLAAYVASEAIKRIPGFSPKDVEDIILGCAFPEAQQGFNAGRVVGLLLGMDDGEYTGIPGLTLNRFCASGFDAIDFARFKIMGGKDVVIAGGIESMSLIPTIEGGNDFLPNPVVLEKHRNFYLPMGDTAEFVAKRFEISREEQDTFALRSHQKAIAAIESGRFADEIVGVPFGPKGRLITVDEGPRSDTSLEALRSLPAAFFKNGTVTAGNSSQMSDGAAVVVLMSEKALKHFGVTPLAEVVDYVTVGYNPAEMGAAPIDAIRSLMRRNGMGINDFGLIELNEAFAAQSLAVKKVLEIPEDRLNVNGGAIALGHPLGCSGVRIPVTLIHEMKKRGIELGLASACVGGGQGVAMLIRLLC